MPNRRQFVSTAAAAVGAAALGTPRLLSSAPHPAHVEPSDVRAPTAREPSRALSILILGGTSFIGPHQIAYALERGHSVTTFTRGQTRPTVHADLFDQVESLIGDRESDLSALEGRTWDAVIDNSGRRVEWTEATARLLVDAADRYLYTSSTGVYYPYRTAGVDESAPVVLEWPEGLDREREGSYAFGIMKANSERVAREVFGEDRTVVVRPTYIWGPADRTDRFAHWPVRLERGGEVLVPGKADDPVQWIDVRDVAEWSIRLLEDGTTGTFNAVGPAARTGMLRFVHGAHAAFGSAVDFVQVDDYDFLQEQRLTVALPWILPLDEHYASARIANARAIEAGMTFRPLATTIRDVFEWWHSDAVAEERRKRLLADERSLIVREPDLLAAWRARGPAG
ncbi:MAG: NAD-dependent epimerase/dehydratase family protein [Gemmatimonadetes bacterium]|nr:NAD-dependent epimerase/dehydratase family protein [Gemmatimonadota bacterium]